MNEKGDTRLQAGGLVDKMEELEFVLLLKLWTPVLEEFHKTSKALQDPKIALSTCSDLYRSLSNYVKDMREKFDKIEQDAKSQLPGIDYRSTKKRKRTRKKPADDDDIMDAVDELGPREKFRVSTFIVIIDALEKNLRERAAVYKYFADKFSFLVDIEASDEQILESVKNLKEEYPGDIDINLVSELKHFFHYVKRKEDIYLGRATQLFPNVEVVLRLFLTLMVTNRSGERPFSGLKRTTMKQEKLCSLSLVYIEKGSSEV